MTYILDFDFVAYRPIVLNRPQQQLLHTLHTQRDATLPCKVNIEEATLLCKVNIEEAAAAAAAVGGGYKIGSKAHPFVAHG